MKVIDLLNKIANGEDTPEKIIFKNELYILKKWENIEETDYVCESTGNLLGDIYLTSLNEKVQIIEDTPKEDKKIEKFYFSVYQDQKLGGREVIEPLETKINEIIDKVNGR
jgi:hypothetical protein